MFKIPAPLVLWFLFVSLLVSLISEAASETSQWPNYPSNPYRIPLDVKQRLTDSSGGIIVADVNQDGLLDFLVSTQDPKIEDRGTLGAYDHWGKVLWIKNDIDIGIQGQAEVYGLPGHHGPGVSTADINRDGQLEVIHLNSKNEIVIRNGLNGDIEKKIQVPLPRENALSKLKYSITLLIDGHFHKNDFPKKVIRRLVVSPKRWSHFQVVNLKGNHDNEIILQADPAPFRWLKAISLMTGETLWEFNDYIGLAHGGFRAADIDGDGFDEIVGAIAIDHDGSQMNDWEYRKISGHFDSLYIADILPHQPGLEWVLLEESHENDDRTALLNTEQIFFYHSLSGYEPQNAAIGEFDVERPGLEIWCRSRFNKDQRPWVIDSEGTTIASYRINEKKPEGWSEKGIEVIYSIDWKGGAGHYLAAKERHTDGKIAVIDPLTGEFLQWWEENAARVYVADVAGDRREEIVVLNSKDHEIRVYWNPLPSESLRNEPRYWQQNHYLRQKLNYNYYSP